MIGKTVSSTTNEKQREINRAAQRRYRIKHREALLAYKRNWYKANKERCKEHAKKRVPTEASLVKMKATRKRYYIKHKEAHAIYVKRYRQTARGKAMEKRSCERRKESESYVIPILLRSLSHQRKVTCTKAEIPQELIEAKVLAIAAKRLLKAAGSPGVKELAAEKRAVYVAAHREERLKYLKEWRTTHIEKVKVANTEWRLKNQERLKLKAREWRLEHAEEILVKKKERSLKLKIERAVKRQAYLLANAESVKIKKDAQKLARKERDHARNKANRLANPEKYRLREKAYRLANPEKQRLSNRNFYRNHPGYSTARAKARRLAMSKV